MYFFEQILFAEDRFLLCWAVILNMWVIQNELKSNRNLNEAIFFFFYLNQNDHDEDWIGHNDEGMNNKFVIRNGI
jgi:hypothetical protein